MAITASGPIRFSDISNEFGLPTEKNLGAYRLEETYGNLTLPLDTGIPSSGEVKFSDFYGKKQGVVVDFYTDTSVSNPFRKNAKTRYGEPNGAFVVGRTALVTSIPVSTSGKRIIIHVNREFGSNNLNRNNVALKTGTWDSGTEVQVVVGPSGGIYGAGGNGGAGGRIPGNAGQGGQGSSALGIEYPTTIINQGVIFGGRGGGGGGAGGYGWTFSNVQDGCEGRNDQSLRIGGGGGAGGRGYPGGTGGQRNTQSALAGGASANFAGSGSSGTTSLNGSAGGGGSTSGGQGCNRHAFSGGGGAIESNGNGGNVSYGGQGQGGQRGYAIIISPSGNLISYSGNPEDGDTINGTVS